MIVDTDKREIDGRPVSNHFMCITRKIFGYQNTGQVDTDELFELGLQLIDMAFDLEKPK